MNSQAIIRRIAFCFAFLAGVSILTALIFLSLTPDQLARIIKHIPYLALRSHLDVATTLKNTPKTLLKGAILLMSYAVTGFWLAQLKPTEVSAPIVAKDDYQLPPLSFTIGTSFLAITLGFTLVSQRLAASLWCDEAAHAAAALEGSWLHIWTTGLPYNMRPYSYLMRLLTECFGFSESLLRLPSVFAYCLYGWFLAVVCWTKNHRLASSITGIVIMLFFLITPGSIYTASQARGHMPAAVLLSGGLWLFIRAMGQPNPQRMLCLSLTSISLAFSMVLTSLAAFLSVWLTLIAALIFRRPLMSLENTRWFYSATAIALAFVFLVYAPMLPRFILWMATNPHSRTINFHPILPWTNGLIGFVAILPLTYAFILRFRNDFASLSVPLSIAGIWSIITLQQHAKFIYAAGAGTAISLFAVLTFRQRLHRKGLKIIVLTSILLMAISVGTSFQRWSVYDNHFVPESMAREQVILIEKSESVLIVGHCNAPRFYLRRKGISKITSVQNRYDLDQLLAAKSFDWIILNGSAAGNPRDIVQNKVIPPMKYHLVYQPQHGSEEIWTWRLR